MARLLRLCELHHARLRRREAGQVLESAWADDRNEWRPVVRVVYYGVFEVLRMTLLAGDEGDLHKREWPKWFCARYALP